MNAVSLKSFRNDPHAACVVCDKCKATGEPMSRNWNYDEANKCWEPQPRHIPDCKHFAVEREQAKGVVAKFTGLVPVLM